MKKIVHQTLILTLVIRNAEVLHKKLFRERVLRVT